MKKEEEELQEQVDEDLLEVEQSSEDLSAEETSLKHIEEDVSELAEEISIPEADEQEEVEDEPEPPHTPTIVEPEENGGVQEVASSEREDTPEPVSVVEPEPVKETIPAGENEVMEEKEEEESFDNVLVQPDAVDKKESPTTLGKLRHFVFVKLPVAIFIMYVTSDLLVHYKFHYQGVPWVRHPYNTLTTP